MNTEPTDWNARREEHRETEWQLRNRVLRLVETILDRWESDAEKFGTLEALTKQAELVSKLGRLATAQDAGAPQANGISEEFLTSLLRIQPDAGETDERTTQSEQEGA
jgi:hypothetical protein